jgi:type I site-specific restriction endonuclease
MSNNQNPEQIARNNIDRKLNDAGWVVQEKSKIDWSASRGIAVKEYLTDVGPADYVLFVDKKPAGIIEAKRDEEGHRLTVVENQSCEYASSKLKYLIMTRCLLFTRVLANLHDLQINVIRIQGQDLFFHSIDQKLLMNILKRDL